MNNYNFTAQLDRAKRFLNRIQKPANNQIDFEDNLWSFFIHAWHVYDWIWYEFESKTGYTTKKKFKENLVTTYPHLAVCAGLANRIKHFELKDKSIQNVRHTRTNVTIHLAMLYVVTGENLNKRNLEQQAPRRTYEYFVTDNNNKVYNALDVAKNTISEWESIIKSLPAKAD